jgi:hypothetical protein
MCTISMVDESCDGADKLRLNVFSRSSSTSIEYLAKTGDILLLNGAIIQRYNNKPQGVVSDRTSWYIFNRNASDFNYCDHTGRSCEYKLNNEPPRSVSGLNPIEIRIVRANSLFTDFDIERVS